MDKTSKRILNCLSKAPDHTIFYYDDWTDEISDIDEDIIFAAIRYLIKKDLCERCTNQNGQSIGVRLSHEGIHRSEFFRIRMQEFLYKSIVIPIIVAMLTTLATTACAYYWKKIINNKETTNDVIIAETIETCTEIPSTDLSSFNE